MEILSNTVPPQLTDEQTLTARLEAASYLGDTDGQGIKVRVDIEKDKFDPSIKIETVSAELLVDSSQPEAGSYKVSSSTNGLLITQPGAERQEVVTDPERLRALIGGFATKLQAAIEAAGQPAESRLKATGLLGRFARHSTEMADAA